MAIPRHEHWRRDYRARPYRTLFLGVLREDDVDDFLDFKFEKIAAQTEAGGIDLEIDPDTIDRIKRLSGGHLHLLQVLGSQRPSASLPGGP